MTPASALRRQIEAFLAERIPSALTPVPRLLRPRAETGIPSVDALLEGGFPLGAITEIVGPECSGRTSLALSFITRMTRAARVGAWIDVSDAFDPESAAAAGMDLRRLLWVRCGVSVAPAKPSTSLFNLPDTYLNPPQITKGLHGGGFGPHPRTEIKGLSHAVGNLLCSRDGAQPQTAKRKKEVSSQDSSNFPSQQGSTWKSNHLPSSKPWSRIDQALRVTDLLLQAGGFSSIVLDMGGIAPEHASRVPLATWFRYRAAAERSLTSIILLTQHACAKSSAALALTLQPDNAPQDDSTVFKGVKHRVEVKRERFSPAPSNVIPLRKPPQSENGACWQSRSSWTCCR